MQSASWLPNMHGQYALLHSTSNENRDLKPGEVNLKKLGTNFLFSSDKVPHQNPWARTALFSGDFILIAEFAENEGPKPVMTIPKNGGGNFDINAFAVHVMSVDYTQARHSNFSIVEDTQLLLSEKKEGIYAYVHHFTLNDIHARGFVRPYCMCYISRCRRKMFYFLDRLMDEFGKVSRLLRHGNRITFLRDLEQRLADVLAMKTLCTLENSNLEKSTGQKPKEMEKSKSNVNEEYDNILSETKKLIEVLKPHMHDSKIVQQFKRLESLAEGRSRSFTDAAEKQGKSEHKLPSFAKQQPSLRRAVSLPDIKNLLSANKQENSALNLKPKSGLPSYLNSIKHLRHLHDLCEWGAKEGLNRLRTILKHYGRETAALMIEQTETSHLERFPSLLTIGRSVVCNVLQKIDMKCVSNHWPKESFSDPPTEGRFTRNSSSGSLYSLESFQSCLDEELVGSARSNDGMFSPFVPSSSFHAGLQGDKLECSSYGSSDDARTENSDVMSIHSDTSLTSARERLLLADYVLTDEDALSDNGDPHFRRQTSAVCVPNISMRHNHMTGLSRSLESINTTSSDIEIPRFQRTRKRKLDYSILRKGVASTLTSAKSDNSSSSSTLEVPPRNTNSRNNPSVRDVYMRSKSEGGSGSCSPSREEKLPQKRLLSYTRPERIRLRCFAEEVSQPLETYTGSNVLLLRNSLSCGVHLLFALLCGRPVVVLADPRNERDVRIVVSALWMFVPENMSHGKAVVPWRTKPLQIADLAWLKLVGLAKSKHHNMVPKSVKRFVSVLDFETDLIVTPQYKGHYLRSFCNYGNQWPTNAALVAFVHSVFLELASKAYVYYYTYCLGGLQWCRCKSQRSDPGQAVEMRDGSEILSRLRVHFSDAKIVQHFAELIKQQQIDFQQSLFPDQDCSEEGAVSADSENQSLLITTDLSKCAVFRNVRPLEVL